MHSDLCLWMPRSKPPTAESEFTRLGMGRRMGLFHSAVSSPEVAVVVPLGAVANSGVAVGSLEEAEDVAGSARELMSRH